MTFPQFRLTAHARKRMAERSISENTLRETLSQPTRVGRDARQRMLVKKLYERNGKKRLLMLALKRENAGWCVITVIDTTKIKKYL